MKPHDAFPSNLQGLVLASDPQLQDPNFRETLVYMAEHDEHGSLGFILNRPLGHSLRDLVHPDGNIDEFMLDVPVYFGGPVNRENLFLVLFERGANDEEITCRINLPAEELAPYMGASSSWIRAYLGYSGWGEGQLESELANEAWSLQKPHTALMAKEASPGLWSVFTGSDQRWRTLAPFLPDNPSQN